MRVAALFALFSGKFDLADLNVVMRSSSLALFMRTSVRYSLKVWRVSWLNTALK